MEKKDLNSLHIKLDHLLEKVNENKKETNEKIDKLTEKVDKLDEKTDNHDKVLTRNTDSLEHHIKRTDLSEKRIETLEKDSIEAKTAFKTVAVIASLLGGIIGFLIKYFA